MRPDEAREDHEAPRGGGGGPAAAPPGGLTEAAGQVLRGALAPVRDALNRVGDLPIVGGGLRRAAEGIASVGRDDVASYAEARRAYATAGEARDAFHEVAAELLAPNAWSAASGIENAEFAHHDVAGRAIEGRRPARPGDFVRVTLPFAGVERNDWVRVDAVLQEQDHVAVVVRPSWDPTRRPVRRDVIAHFFAPTATNAFELVRDGRELVARIRGEHERANTGPEAGGPADAVRNRLAAEAGWGVRRADRAPDRSLDGPQQHQWNRFAANLLGLGFVP